MERGNLYNISTSKLKSDLKISRAYSDEDDKQTNDFIQTCTQPSVFVLSLLSNRKYQEWTTRKLKKKKRERERKG